MSTDIEKLAVSELVARLVRCPHLDPEIQTNDKTLLTDGHIDIHRKRPFSKKTFYGRVAVQVKGRRLKNRQKSVPSTFTIDRTSIEGYSRGSGLIYFVIFIDENNRSYIRYTLLNPFKLKELLKENPKKKYISVKLRSLPEADQEIESLLHLSYARQKENLELEQNLKIFDRVTGITIFPDRKLDFSRPTDIDIAGTDCAVTIHTDDGLSLPTDLIQSIHVIPQEYTEHFADYKITSGTTTFESISFQKIDDNMLKIQLNKGLNLVISESKNEGSLEIDPLIQDNLSECLKNMRFYFSFFETGELLINDEIVKFQAAGYGNSKNLREYLTYLEKLEQVFNTLDIDTDFINLDDINQKQFSALNGLHRSLIEGELAPFKYQHPTLYTQRIGEWFIEIVIVPDSVQPDKVRFVSLFSDDAGMDFDAIPEGAAGSAEPRLVTPYELIRLETFPYVLNLNLTKIVEYYNHIQKHEESLDLAGQMVLRLIKAADSLPIRKLEFLQSASSLNEWLISQSNEQFVHLINRWQIMARQNVLTRDIQENIRQLRSSPFSEYEGNYADHESLRVKIRFACSVLLEDKKEADFCLQKLDNSDQKLIQTWPIWSLYQALV